MAAKREKFHFHTHRHHLHVQLLNYDFPKKFEWFVQMAADGILQQIPMFEHGNASWNFGSFSRRQTKILANWPPLFLQQNGLESKKLFKTHDKTCFLGPMFLISSTVFVELNCFWGQTNKKVSACLYFDIKMWKLKRP